MSLKTFNSIIQSGKWLVILNDLVIDVSNYLGNHPGGKRALTGNIGRDVTKFFNGGYQYTNFNGLDDQHNHSKLSTELAMRMTIGRLEKCYPDEWSVKLIQVSS